MLCFSIRLKSHVDLYLSEGCTIFAADSPKPGDTLRILLASHTTAS